MSDQNNKPPAAGHPAVVHRPFRPSLVWLVPLIAIAISLGVFAHSWMHKGPVIAISFKTAAGLVAGKTPVKYKDVTVGTVSSVELSDDGSRIVAKVQMEKSGRSIVNAGSRFWVVRPRVGIGGASGIDTLLSGAYIGVDKGSSTAEQHVFTGLENPPVVINGTPGKSFVLHTEDLASLDINSPVYYRRIQVGRIASYTLDQDGGGVTLQIFVDAPYDKLVHDNTRFWNASGVDISLNASGLKVNTQSLATVIAGGIAFSDPLASAPPTKDAQARFVLAKDEQTALAPPSGPSQFYLLRFDKSLHGLAVGAPVYFAGIELGKVVSIDLDYDGPKRRFPTLVGIEVYPLKMGNALAKLPRLDGTPEQKAATFLAVLVQNGLRAQARSASLLTGQLYISLDFVEHAPKVDFDVNARPLTLPTMPGGFDQIEDQMSEIVSKINKMPIESIAKNLDKTLSDLDGTLTQVNAQVLPATTQTLQQAQQTFGRVNGLLQADSPLQQNLGQTLEEVQRTAQSLRTVTDLLGRHPESLLRGIHHDQP